MKYKTKSLIHFIRSTLFSIIARISFIVAFVIFDQIGQLSFEITPRESFGITFGISILSLSIVYGFLTAALSGGSNPFRILLPWILCTLSMSMILSAILYSFDGIIDNQFLYNQKVLKNITIIVMSLLSIILIIFGQIFNTKFLLSSTAKDRSEEWEINNFFNLLFTKSSINHNNEISYLKSKKITFVIKFIPEEEIERDVIVEGDTVSKIVKDVQKNVKNDNEVPVIVYLSNKLPKIIGNSKNILIIKDSDLFKNFKKMYKEKK